MSPTSSQQVSPQKHATQSHGQKRISDEQQGENSSSISDGSANLRADSTSHGKTVNRKSKAPKGNKEKIQTKEKSKDESKSQDSTQDADLGDIEAKLVEARPPLVRPHPDQLARGSKLRVTQTVDSGILIQKAADRPEDDDGYSSSEHFSNWDLNGQSNHFGRQRHVEQHKFMDMNDLASSSEFDQRLNKKRSPSSYLPDIGEEDFSFGASSFSHIANKRHKSHAPLDLQSRLFSLENRQSKMEADITWIKEALSQQLIPNSRSSKQFGSKGDFSALFQAVEVRLL